MSLQILLIIKRMSNYYPKTMNGWKIHKRSGLDLSFATSKVNIGQNKYRSLIIHSLNCNSSSIDKTRIQSAKQFPVHSTPRKKYQGKKSGGFRTVDKDTKISEKALFNCRYNSVQQREQTKSSLNGTSPRQTFWKSNGFKKNKQHKERQLKTLETMKNIGITKMIIINKQKLPVPKRKKTSESKIHLWDAQSQEEFSPYREKEKLSIKQSRINMRNEHTEGEKEFFFEVKESHLHCRSSQTLNGSRKQLKGSFRDIEHKRKQRMQRVQRMRTQNFPITPWEAKEKEAQR